MSNLGRSVCPIISIEVEPQTKSASIVRPGVLLILPPEINEVSEESETAVASVVPPTISTGNEIVYNVRFSPC